MSNFKISHCDKLLCICNSGPVPKELEYIMYITVLAQHNNIRWSGKSFSDVKNELIKVGVEIYEAPKEVLI